MNRLVLLGALSLAVVACSPAADQCTPSSCSGCCDANGQCQQGAFPQACGQLGVACRACGLTDTCQFGACIAAPTCTPTTCSAAGKNCGTILNGCGGQLTCGTCTTAGESCGGGGVANVCAPGTCVPKTCTDLGKNCGQVSDGCGAFLQCGTCSVAGDSCGGGGTMNVCGHGACVPKSCTDLGKNCGTVNDTCGGQLSCGTCTVSGQSCGGSGTSNVCGVGSCTAKTCPQLNATCGTVNDTCGNTLSCGTCSGFETCGGAGTANACGATCIGSCPTGFTCSGGSCTGGNLQSVTFDIPVPVQHVVAGKVTRNGINPAATYCNSTSYGELLEFTHLTDTRFNTSVYASCNTTGAAWAFSVSLYPGSYKVTAKRNTNNTDNLPSWETIVSPSFAVSAPQSNVTFDISVPVQHVVAGKVTRNGINPAATYCNSTSYGELLEFTHLTDTRFNTSVYASCNTTGAVWAFSVSLYPGSYKVTARRNTNNTDNLPSWETIVSPSFAVSAPQSNVTFDIPVPVQHVVAGKVTRNGVNPAATYCNSTSYGELLEFTHLTDTRFNTSVYASCNTTGAAWAFSVSLYPGTYSVTARRNTNNTDNLPSWTTDVSPSFVVSAPQSNVTFNIPVPPQTVVSGTVTRNGVNPAATYCNSTSYGELLDFTHLTDTRFNTSVYASCNTTGAAWTFTVSLYPGTYKVTARRNTNNTDNLPGWETVVVERLTVP